MTKSLEQQGLNRRDFMRAGVGMGVAGMAFTSLAARAAEGSNRGAGPRSGKSPFGGDYGPLKPRRDIATGLNLLALPDGFEYMSFGWTGQTMSDGRPTPTDHDGMAVVDQKGHRIALVRNHELSAGESNQCLVPGGMYNPAEFGGTTNLVFDLKQAAFTQHYTSLGGTIRNCAGGPTPWGSWISCEETYAPAGNRDDGFEHGFVFDVPGWDISDGRPIKAAGRFSHEAVAVDPGTGVVYETEDADPCGFYKYVQPGAGSRNWRGGRGKSELLRDGGLLFAAVVDGVPRRDMRGGFEIGATFSVTWQPVTDPEAQNGRVFDSAPDAAVFTRGEGCWEDKGIIYFVCTDGGSAGLGQVWGLNTRANTLTLVYESRDAADVDGPDNIAVSPRGGIILCEDGGSNPKRLIGLSAAGETFPFVENRIVLSPGDIDIIDARFAGTKAQFWDPVVGDFRSREWAGATFYKEWLFANVQSPGVTFAITGPWKEGAL